MTGACEMKFLQMLLEEIATIKLPGILLEDNTGCIYLIQNQAVGQRTKHIETRMHFIREMFDKKELAVNFVRSEENESDIMTKNLPEALHNKFAIRIRMGKLRLYEQWDEISWAVDNPVEAQREDVGTYVTTYKSVLLSGKTEEKEENCVVNCTEEKQESIVHFVGRDMVEG